MYSAPEYWGSPRGSGITDSVLLKSNQLTAETSKGAATGFLSDVCRGEEDSCRRQLQYTVRRVRSAG